MLLQPLLLVSLLSQLTLLRLLLLVLRCQHERHCRLKSEPISRS
jgi:hypothetical protein